MGKQDGTRSDTNFPVDSILSFSGGTVRSIDLCDRIWSFLVWLVVEFGSDGHVIITVTLGLLSLLLVSTEAVLYFVDPPNEKPESGALSRNSRG
jgi:hypothetical protein